MMLIQNQHSIQKTLLNAIASLTIISTRGFGNKCLFLLGSLLGSSTNVSLKLFVKSCIKSTVLVYISNSNVKLLPPKLISGLGKIIHTEDHASLFEDFTDYFMDWLKSISQNKVDDGKLIDKCLR